MYHSAAYSRRTLARLPLEASRGSTDDEVVRRTSVPGGVASCRWQEGPSPLNAARLQDWQLSMRGCSDLSVLGGAALSRAADDQVFQRRRDRLLTQGHTPATSLALPVAVPTSGVASRQYLEYSRLSLIQTLGSQEFH